MSRGPRSEGVYVVLVDGGDDPLYRLIGLFATAEEAESFADEVRDFFPQGVEIGNYELGWRYDARAPRISLE